MKFVHLHYLEICTPTLSLSRNIGGTKDIVCVPVQKLGGHVTPETWSLLQAMFTGGNAKRLQWEQRASKIKTKMDIHQNTRCDKYWKYVFRK